MAQIGYLDVPQELIDLLRALISPTGGHKTGAVRKAGYLPSRVQVKKLTTRSLLPQISEHWKNIALNEKNKWSSAGYAQGTNGWNLFVQDTAYRIKYGIAGLAIPSVYHQYKVGRIEINAPADSAVLLQYHPPTYYVSKKNAGKTTCRRDVAIHEKLTLPLLLGLSYRSNFTPTKENYEVSFYAEVTSSYQGRTYSTKVGFEIPLQTAWTRSTATTTGIIGVVRSYNLVLRMVGVRGYFEWDNVAAIHSGANFARDFRCNDVNNELSLVNYQIEKSWEEQHLPRGASFDSVYPDDN